MEESYRNELQLQKLHSNIWQKSYVECDNKKVTKTQKSMKVIKENNTTHGTDHDAATGNMEKHTSMNSLNKWRLLVNTL